jgi:hypothetical protein
MSENIILQSIFVFVIIWGIGILLLWFRPRVEVFWKIIGTLIFCFYIVFFFDAIQRGINNFLTSWASFSVLFLKEFLVLLFVNLFLFWPVSLILIFYKADDIGAERLLKFLCILTLVLWVIVLIYLYFDRGVDSHIIDNIRKLFPDGQ